MPKVFITRQIPEAGPKILREKGFEVEISEIDGVMPREMLLQRVKGADAILSLLTDKMNGELFDAAGPQLKIVANFAVGYDNIDLVAAAARKIITTNTPNVLTESVAEMTIALIFGIAKRMAEADNFMRTGQYQGWGPMLLLGQDVIGKTVGLVGLGHIGVSVAKRMNRGFDCPILYYDVVRNEAAEKELGLKFVSLEELLKESDFVSLHTPLTPQTKHLIGEAELKMMKKSTYLINTSRGPVIDEKALVEALKNSVIRGAALDVYEEEPKMAPGLVDLKNTILLPHIASATETTRDHMSELAAQNIAAVLEGKEALTPIKI